MGTDSITIFRGETAHLSNRVPVAPRLTKEFYEQEVAGIFRGGAWVSIASVQDFKEPGSYKVIELPTFKTSVLAVRGEDGELRVFHNVCRHRGDKLVHGGSGCKLRFTCGFHGWRYGANGELLSITDDTQFRGFKREEHGLLPVDSGVWQDLLYINLSKEHGTLEEWMGPLWNQYVNYGQGIEKVSEYRMVLRTNWNLAVNAFCEGYHNLFIHKNTVPDYQGGKGNPMRHRAYLEVGPHFGRYSAHGNQNHKATPAEAAVYAHGDKLFPWFPKTDPGALPQGMNPSHFPEWAFDIVHLFPNCVFNPQAHGYQYLWFWPIDADHTEIRVEAFFRKAPNPGARLAQAYSKVRLREVLREDLATMEAAHAAISSQALPYIVLSQQEMLIQNHYAAANRMLQAKGFNPPTLPSTVDPEWSAGVAAQ